MRVLLPISLFFVYTLLQCISVSYIVAFPDLTIVDERVIIDRRVGATVTVQLGFADEADHQRCQNVPLRLCLTLNGIECTCSNDFIREGIRLTPDCIINDAHWFAITLSIHSHATNNNITMEEAVSSCPIYVPSAISDASETHGRDILEMDTKRSLLTLVLVLTLDDLSRSVVLFNSLRLLSAVDNDGGIIREMLVFVPDHQQGILQTSLMGFQEFLSFPIVVLEESILFRRKQHTPLTLPYARQMAIKLLAAKKVQTEFYITLDADVILLRSFHIHDVLVMDNNETNRINEFHGAEGGIEVMQGKQCGARALYEHEGRFLYHPHWWTGSERLLGIQYAYPERQGFGVTPALLSTYGSLLTIGMIERSLSTRLKQQRQQRHNQCTTVKGNSLDTAGKDGTITTDDDGGGIGNDYHFSCEIDKLEESTPEQRLIEEMQDIESAWLDHFGEGGNVWSEYTLYRLALDHYHIFDSLHLAQLEDSKLEERQELAVEPGLGLDHSGQGLGLGQGQGLGLHVGLNQEEKRMNEMDGKRHHLIKQKRLHCFNVWYVDQLPWQAHRALDPDNNCLFSVIQSSTGVHPGLVYNQWLNHITTPLKN